VASYGARGDSYANDAAALLRANAAPGGGMLYFPVGVYRISSSLTLTKPVLMGANTRFLVDKGVTLRLMAQPRRAPLRSDPLFAGAGA
jgi:polygalacturonase